MVKNRLLLVVLLCWVSVTESSSEEPEIIMEVFSPDDHNLRTWYDLIESARVSPGEADRKLRDESCSGSLSKVTDRNETFNMCKAYKEAMNRSDCPSYLPKAECAVIYMYSTTFYRIYNDMCRNRTWKPYLVFTSLLFSAMKKISSNVPLPKNTILHRGLAKVFVINATGRFYFTQFISTSLNKSVAEHYGNKTLNVFIEQVPKLSASLEGLTEIKEYEVLLSPFESFEMINKTGRIIYLRSSDVQDFLTSPASPLLTRPFFQGAIILILFFMRKYVLIGY